MVRPSRRSPRLGLRRCDGGSAAGPGTDRGHRGRSPVCLLSVLSGGGPRAPLPRATDLRGNERCRCDLDLRPASTGEKVLLAEAAVDVAHDSGGSRSDGGPSAGKQDHNHQLAFSDVVIGAEPAQVSLAIGAGAGLAGERLVLLSPARGAE